jgi:hypothetical protein
MADYLDIGYFTETRNGKKRFVKLGYASPKNDGTGHFLNFDPHIFPGLDVVTLPQRERSQGQGTQEPQRQSAPDIDDEIGF